VVALYIANVCFQPSFVSPSNWASILSVIAPFVIIAMAEAFPILAGNGGLDLSLGPLMGFVTVLIAVVLVPAGISAPEFLIPVVLAIGFGAGLVNGLLVAYLRLPAIIATLGAYLFYTGFALDLQPSPGGSVPSWLQRMSGSYGPFPAVLVPIIAIAILWVILIHTAYRRNLLAVGGDDRAAYTAGIPVKVIRSSAYAFGGLLAAVAGLVVAGMLGGGDATVGPPYTITSIAAVALGGILLAGGRGGLLGAAAGGAIMFLIQNLLTVANVSAFDVNIADGGLLLVALALNSFVLTGRRRRGLAGMRAVSRADGTGGSDRGGIEGG
jgi:ribose transport system permease protein